MHLFDELSSELASYLDANHIAIIEHALQLAIDAHQGQQRQSGEPYISHPIAVAKILASMRMDAATITAAILHDVLEDTRIEKATLTEEFGTEVADLVDGVSKLTQINFENRAEAQAENFRKMLLAMTRDIRVILVKLADRLHNMRTLDSLPPEKRQRIAQETLDIYAPLAHRLGMHNFRIEFEDLGFGALYPLRFRILQNAVQAARGTRKEIVKTIKTAIRNALEKNNLPASAVLGRQKHLYSIYKKMRSKHLSFAEIMDMYAFRIVVEDVDTCYRVLGVIHNLYKPVSNRFKDYIAIPKANGYQSLHTTLFGPYGVPIEIQIRTAEMDNLADNGIAAHWLYKADYQTATDAEIRARAWFKRLLDMQQSTANSLEFIENVKIELFPDEVYVFTPKGRIMELPMGATAVDFAYAVHSDIGNHCIAVKIDRRLAPLSTVLKNGQTVEVITKLDTCPNPDWLNFIVTGKARSNIRYFLKSQRHHASLSLGRELLNNALATLDSSWDQVPDQNCKNLLRELDYKTPNELFEAVGLGYQQALNTAERLLGFTKRERQELVADPAPLAIKGTEGIIVSFAECCRPIPGDPIIGILNAGKGIEIHIEDCPQATLTTKQPEKLISVRWQEHQATEFKVDIRVDLFNQRGVLARLAAAIADANANIDNLITAKHDSVYSTIKFTLLVHDRAHLAQVMRRIRALKVVTRLVRSRPQSKQSS